MFDTPGLLADPSRFRSFDTKNGWVETNKSSGPGTTGAICATPLHPRSRRKHHILVDMEETVQNPQFG